MVILIGGVSCSGKTVMAQKLLEKYKIPYLSIDHIKMGLIRGSKYCDFTSEDDEVELSHKLWPIVKGIIMTNIENEQHIIIEGCYLPPEEVQNFEPEYRERIITLYIGFSPNYIEKKFYSGIVDHRSEIELKEYDDFMNLKNFLNMHLRMREACIKNQANYFEINEHYDQEMAAVYQWMDDQIRLKGYLE